MVLILFKGDFTQLNLILGVEFLVESAVTVSSRSLMQYCCCVPEEAVISVCNHSHHRTLGRLLTINLN